MNTQKHNYSDILKYALKTVVVGTAFLFCSKIGSDNLPKTGNIKNLETRVASVEVNEPNTAELEEAIKLVADEPNNANKVYKEVEDINTVEVNEPNKIKVIYSEPIKKVSKSLDRTEQKSKQKENISYTTNNLSAKEKFYFPIISRESNEKSLDSYLMLAQVKRESGFNPNAHSPAGAIGISQIMPKTAESLGYSPEEMLNPEKCIEAQTKLMRQNYEKFNSENFNDTEKDKLSLASYNAGYGHIRNSIKMVRAANEGQKMYDVVKYKNKKKIIKRVNIEGLKGCNETWDDGFSKALKLINPIDSGQTITYVSDIMDFYGQYKNKN